jgi:DNA phosphorothioation-dependent restriction protein DptG
MNFQFFEEHSLDSVLLSHQHCQQYLHIPVNASSWGKKVFHTAGFVGRQQLKQDYKTIIFFRDPIDRWLSGLSTWLTYRLPQHTPLDQVRNNTALLDTLFDTVRQDDHTERQTFFTQNVDWSIAECFYIDSAFHGSVNQYFFKQLRY